MAGRNGLHTGPAPQEVQHAAIDLVTQPELQHFQGQPSSPQQRLGASPRTAGSTSVQLAAAPPQSMMLPFQVTRPHASCARLTAWAGQLRTILGCQTA